MNVIPLVSVVLPVYNGERYVCAAVNSLLEQTLHNIEIIIINDGSTDKTEEIINEFVTDPRVRLVSQRHRGQSQSRNRGISLSKAKYIAVHDADGISLPDRLETQYTFLEKFPDFGLIGSSAEMINETGQVLGVIRGMITDPHEIQMTLLKVNYFVHSSVMMQKSACEAAGKYREEFSVAEDYDLWLRMAERYQMGYISEVLYQYRDHPGNISKKKAHLQQVQAQIARELAHERRQTGSDILLQGGPAAFFHKYGAKLETAGLSGFSASPAPPSLPSETSTSFTAAPVSMALATTEPTPAQRNIELTIGMATYNDFDGVYFTLQALRLFQDLEHTELLVIDNYGCQHTKNLVEGWLKGRYIRATDVAGTAAPRDLVFREARGNAVLCCDCHVLFPPGVIAQLKQFYREHPDCQDLLQGPLLYDDAKLIATHFDPVWRDQMWGTWASDPRGEDLTGEPFEIPMQGLGVFSCLKGAWLGFHPEFRGFGGEEGYIHEKFRQAGRRCLCLPWFRWMHRFGRPSGVKYAVTVENKLRNYVIGHAELGLDLVPVLRHFSAYLSRDQVLAITEQALGRQWAGSSLIFEADVCDQTGKQYRVGQDMERDMNVIPPVSVVLPVYNGERWVYEIVVDNQASRPSS